MAGAVVDRLERELSAARHGGSAAYVSVLERAVEACRTQPQAGEAFDLPELYLELATEYQTLGRWEDALAAADAAIAAGLVLQPDSRCLRAEILMRSGRVAAAEPIWAAVRADTPQDVWLYNSAGLEYADVGDHETALAWWTDGLELALRSGDPQRLVDQLAELRAESLHALGRSDDALQERAAGFARERDAGRAAARSTAVSAGSNDSARHGATALAWAWLPADDYAVAAALWPDLAESDLLTSPDGPVGHAQYCRALQARLVEASVAGLSGLMIAPVRVPAFVAWCAERGRAPDSPSRAEYAAQLAAASDPALIGWPPGRNEPCWCGSGRKYKKCCAASAFADPGHR